MKNLRVLWSLACALLLTMHVNTVFAEGKKIMKWVDEKGRTHYGDVLPTDYNSQTKVLNAQGLEVKSNANKATSADAGLSSEQIEQQRNDKALLASYTTEQEIDLALARHLQGDELALQSLKQRKAAAEKQRDANKKNTDTYLTYKKPIPADLTQETQAKDSEISRIDAQIKQQQASMDAAKKRYAEDKKRFVELKASSSAR